MPQNRATLMCIAALLMAGCGGAMDEATAEPATTESASQALYPEYDPDIHCLVSSQYVSCRSGPTMYAYYSPDWGYYINRDVCGRNGPLICPLY
ncbi:putative lipoprotein [Myxococcus xanthus DK 1622]|uniref:Lipoprotein n=1 Tax=Myxococcus xanthus (strain DK1622) TaxID=246197 RepID=Q1CZ23_MYXXD|nr:MULTISPECIES: hypothetical protein [Myxococcus]ABF90818.1 putative lipoprotein [Myxococcus xanthus DK 1622]NOJ55937.1 hypothetical protein [Myxococcus xanthus]QPM78599.1 hypothetical protein I5Q59_30700 [Myxococcus xanthus]QVW67669.1 hypothetical protein JTM82_36050 [Myxococcus xanthus DZ2]QZZ53850.1 hypothetical protein MyxoNM_31970 [Myxococcus xanthus]